MATSSRFSSSSLKDEIKGVIKSEFEKSVKSLCSEEELKKFRHSLKVILNTYPE